MKRGLPVVVPPEPALMLGQTRTTVPASPVQLAESVAVESIAVLSVGSTVPKLRFVIVNPQLMGVACADPGLVIAAAATSAPSTSGTIAKRRFIGTPPVRRRPGCPCRA